MPPIWLARTAFLPGDGRAVARVRLSNTPPPDGHDRVAVPARRSILSLLVVAGDRRRPGGVGPVSIGGPPSAPGHRGARDVGDPGGPAPGKIDHIVVIELENEGYETTLAQTHRPPTSTRCCGPRGNCWPTTTPSGTSAWTTTSPRSPASRPPGHPGGLRGGLRGRHTGHPDHRGPGGRPGVRLPGQVPTIAAELDAKYPPNPKTHVASWRAYEEDMGNTRPGTAGSPTPPAGPTAGTRPSGGHPAVVAAPATSTPPATTRSCGSTPSSTTRPCATPTWCRSAPSVPRACPPERAPGAGLSHLATTPRFAFITPNLCDDGHDTTCAGHQQRRHTGGRPGRGRPSLRHWVPLLVASPAYRTGTTLLVITFDEADVDPSANPAYAAACCNEQPGPNTAAPGTPRTPGAQAPGGGQIGALLLNPRYLGPAGRHHRLLQPLCGAAELRGPAGPDVRGHRQPRAPRLGGCARARALRQGRLQPLSGNSPPARL